MSTLLIIFALSIYLIFYFTYGKFLQKRIVGETEIEVPSKRMNDGVDYIPAHRLVLFGHHFASIAGAGPIVGPVLALAWGWLPAILWIWIGNVLIGAVHDYLSLMVSVRYDGKSIQYVAKDLLGKNAGISFLWFVLFLVILVIGAFAAIIADTFVSVPGSSTAYILQIIAALILGVLLYRSKLPFWLSSLIGIILLAFSIYGGFLWPIHLTYHTWIIILFFYIIIASAIPVNILLQPRDYLNSYLLYFGMLVGIVAALMSLKSFDIPAFTSFSANVIGGKSTPYWPAIPLIIACGALSGFHSMVASGTSSKQLASEGDGLFIGYGSMLTEGFLSTIVIVSIGAFGFTALGSHSTALANAHLFGQNYISQFVGNLGGAVAAFSKSYATMVSSMLHIGYNFMVIIASMWVAAFALTTLDTTNRIARYIVVEISEPLQKESITLYKFFTNRWIASIIPAFFGILLAWTKKYTVLWPAFSGANQLLASIALITVSVWIYKKLNRKYLYYALIPGVFLWITVTGALIWYTILIVPGYVKSNPLQGFLVGIIMVIMLILNFVLLFSMRSSFKKGEE
ncbi:MAG TPA: carbon starvation protein A [Bacteroidetes bacterium]|nr:carbon starvation protein A [Bacteroidota bacterium]